MKGDSVLKYDLAETEKEAIMICSKDLSILLSEEENCGKFQLESTLMNSIY
jgi:hypothetical protein